MNQKASIKNKPKVALVLTGGGARAAYQVGVLKAIAEQYPRNHASPFSILCGTSAGAINATALGVYASCFRLGVKKLEYIWRNFKCKQVFRTDSLAIAKQLSSMVCKSLHADYSQQQGFSLLNNQPLQTLLNDYLNYKRIDQNIATGYLHALSVTASNYQDGQSLSFFQAKQHQQNWQRARRLGRKTQIHTSHLLASTAIPLIFPAEKVGQDYYGDGSIHQLCPLSPAIHLGADKILAIHLEQPRKPNCAIDCPPPNSATIAGHLLDSVFSDTLNSDLERLQRINRTIELLTPQQQKQLDLRPIHSLSIKPNIDFEQTAHNHFSILPLSVRLMLATLGIKKDKPSAITSFLMFEQDYTNYLIREGYQNTSQQIDKILAFLED
ncbi:patatin-like phospholipase family protein [Agarivorans sp. B2Z047]|uniref:patatin-like phospholipase family protein n=1 Tax=Agarivorans sp. B2Z047 TaxID=2652721 RepID=UPI00128D5C12|nr:patatin-like phospholipase family protein [Agarivorans sp. B2Z047]MPW27396.1 patatin-like phospholipase family protein [Agarivorans sp. B2Z047]UQN44761.1 patatin-like phospholipase family protein [Agarivorans sp. B2Z047]